jgi:NagD protein
VLGKPNAEMLLQIAQKFDLDISEVMMIGDRLQTDIMLAVNAGAVSVKIRNPKEDGVYDLDFDIEADITVNHLGELQAMMP